MALCNSLLLLLLLLLLMMFFNSLSISTQETHSPKPFKQPLKNHSLSLSFPLTILPLSHHFYLLSSQPSSPFNYRSSLKYSRALIVSLPIGTPPQTQQMVLDTGSQLSWIQCHHKKAPLTASFDPSLSSSFSLLPCNHSLCKILHFTLPTTCDQNRLCRYSYFYADGTYAEGNLAREKITLYNYRITSPLILGCATKSGTESGPAQGILGMNLGRLSFPSQAKVKIFSYCVPIRQTKIKPRGIFYLGQNPNSRAFQYVGILNFPQSQRMPNLDPLAYTVPMEGIRIGGKKLNISAAAFRPDAGGSGQTIVDSGTEYTFLVEVAYNKVREEIVRLAGAKLRKGYVYQESLDMCFDGVVMEIGRLIGDLVFEFEKGVEVIVAKERILDDVGGGVHCFGIGRSNSLGVPSNLIGNFHQQNLWVEFDLSNRRVGFGKADCRI